MPLFAKSTILQGKTTALAICDDFGQSRALFLHFSANFRLYFAYFSASRDAF